MASATPLLAADVEKGCGAWPMKKKSVSQAELDAELVLGRMSRQEMMMLLSNPNNWPFAVMVAICLFVFFRIIFFEIIEKPGHLPGYVMVTLLICFFGLLGATYNTFLAVQMQQQIDRFRALNKQLKGQVDRLEGKVDELGEISDNLKSELNQFQALKDQMHAFAAEQQGDFKQVFEKAMGVFEDMKKTAKQLRVQILQQLAQQIEFLDQEEGITETEWKRFCARVPQEYKGKLAGKTFQSLAGSDSLIHFPAMAKVIEEITADA